MKSRFAFAALLMLACALFAPMSSFAEANTPQARRAAARAERERLRLARRSRSVGMPWQGRLEHGLELRESPSIRRTTEYAPAGNFFGTFELVQLIERAAAGVARKYPGAKLSVGELSKRAGGEIDGHGSHENGRDVDLSFYILDGSNRPFSPFAFAQFDGNGQARAPNQGLRFDDDRNWDLVSRLVTDPDARVQYIFVARPIRERLLSVARRKHASARAISRAEAVLVQPAEGHPHRNHFHVRIYCDPGDQPQCRDREPFHAWAPGH